MSNRLGTLVPCIDPDQKIRKGRGKQYIRRKNLIYEVIVELEFKAEKLNQNGQYFLKLF